MPPLRRIHVIDSHTGGEPTRVVLEGGPELGQGSLAEQLEAFRARHDRFRSAIVNEPRGSEVLVGALLCQPQSAQAAAGVIFFNNVGFLGMCGHGAIGVIETLAHLGRIRPGLHHLETPVGTIEATLREDRSVTIANVPSWRARKDLSVALADGRELRGDVAWGGNWFFLVSEHGQDLRPDRASELAAFALAARSAVNELPEGREVDHVELFGPPTQRGAHSRNFVLCPGGAWDRSPCGTGTSAKLACLAADGKLAEGEEWVQESITASLFRGRYRWLERASGRIAPAITGRAYVIADSQLLLDAADPLCWGFR